MNGQDLCKRLAEPFSAADVEWRIQQTTQDKKRGMAVPYINSRAIQNLLDEVVGPFGWQTKFIAWHQLDKGSQLCALSIFDQERGEWITKVDGAENSDIEPIKGGISDSFKRAAVLWGIGRYLYSVNAVWVDVEQRGKGFFIKDSELNSLHTHYEQMVKRLGGTVQPRKQTVAATPKPAAIAAPSAQSSVFTFDYTVKDRKLSDDGKITAVSLCDRQGNNIFCLCPGNDPQIAQGICLRNVKLAQQTGANNQVFTVLQSYEIAA